MVFLHHLKRCLEAIRAESVTVGQRRLDVARLEAQAAEQERIANIRRGEGEGARRRLAMQADGALDRKLEAYVTVNRLYADAIARYGGAWVPSVVMGSNGSASAGSGAQALVDMFTARTARDLGLDMRVPNRATTTPAQP